MTSRILDPSAIADMARGENRERLIDIGHDVPADLKDISEIKPEILAAELGRLTKILDDEYHRVIENEADQAETEIEPKVAAQRNSRKRKPKGSREQAWADMDESVKRKPPAYWSD